MNALRPLCFALLLCISSFHCTDRITEPPVDEERIKLTLFDVSVQEAFIHVALGEETAGGTVYVYRDNNQIATYTLSVSDTVIYDSSLQENTDYLYRAEIRRGGSVIVLSNDLTVLTLLPSSRDSEWQTFTFGEHSSSILRDVAIIDENNIWVVGEIYMNDENGEPDPILYNAAFWDGEKWQVKRIVVNYRGNSSIAPLEGVLSLPDGKVVFSSGLPYLPNDDGWRLYHLWDIGVLDENDGGVGKIWGTSINNIYFAGRNGTIVHYDGTQWRSLESGTTTDITDIWGLINPITGDEEIYCAVTDFVEYTERGVLKIVNKAVTEMIPREQEGGIASVWTNNGVPLYSSGHGVYRFATGDWKEITIGTNAFTTEVRGTGLNDIFVSGHFGTIAHYNGVDWHIFPEVYNALYFSVAVRDNIVVAAGTRDGKAVVSVGRRK